MTWNEIKISIINDLNTRGLSNPSIRINALERLEGIMKSHFIEILANPTLLKKIDKNAFKANLAKYKTNGTLNGAESSVVNEIYYRI
jgi:hypothetical protein